MKETKPVGGFHKWGGQVPARRSSTSCHLRWMVKQKGGSSNEVNTASENSGPIVEVMRGMKKLVFREKNQVEGLPNDLPAIPRCRGGSLGLASHKSRGGGQNRTRKKEYLWRDTTLSRWNFSEFGCWVEINFGNVYNKKKSFCISLLLGLEKWVGLKRNASVSPSCLHPRKVIPNYSFAHVNT